MRVSTAAVTGAGVGFLLALVRRPEQAEGTVVAFAAVGAYAALLAQSRRTASEWLTAQILLSASIADAAYHAHGRIGHPAAEVLIGLAIGSALLAAANGSLGWWLTRRRR